MRVACRAPRAEEAIEAFLVRPRRRRLCMAGFFFAL